MGVSSAGSQSSALGSPGGLLKHKFLPPPTPRSPPPADSDLEQGLGWEFAFVTSSQVTLMLLVQVPHFENQSQELSIL